MTVWILGWLWQGCVVAAGAALLLKAFPRTSAATRYVVWYAALVILAWLGWLASPLYSHDRSAAAAAASEALFYVDPAPEMLLAVCFGIWAAVALVKLAQLVPAVHRLFALRDRCRPVPAELEHRLPLWLDAKRRGRRADLVVSDEVDGATVLGLHKPCIALSPALLACLTPSELDLVILHEHAHVLRRDDWFRLVEALLLPVLWIHPAAAYVARSLNLEREAACDDLVISRTGLAREYARCLARAAELRTPMRPAMALAPGLFDRRGHLVRRVDRLLSSAARKISVPLAIAAVCALGAAAIHVRAFPLVAEAVAFSMPKVDSARLEFTPPALSALPWDAAAAPSIPQETPSTTADRPLALAGDLISPPVQAEQDTSTANSEQSGGAAAASVIQIPSRPLEGRYVQPQASPDRAALAPWDRASAAGVRAGAAATRAGVGLAGAFARAGKSIGSKF